FQENLVYAILFYGLHCFQPYLRRTCSVPFPYFLQSEVPLSGECTEQVRLRYGYGMEKTIKIVFYSS
ncbi:hypothetical protein, partial [Bacteroides intestinalis]|uniref:hypothetical protein n=1 Tax=Bacteroides intestinalis TaxID=329854 RepID=UPI001E5EEFF1